MLQGRENLGFTNLPPVCIYNLDEQVYSNLYQVDAACSCGACEWYVSDLDVVLSNIEAYMTPKRIQRCVNCNEIRLSRLDKRIEKMQKLSNACLSSICNILNDQELDNEEVFSILGNMYERFGITIYGEKNFKSKIQENKEINYG